MNEQTISDLIFISTKYILPILGIYIGSLLIRKMLKKKKK